MKKVTKKTKSLIDFKNNSITKVQKQKLKGGIIVDDVVVF